MKATFVSTILAFISTFGIAIATSSEPTKAAFEIDRELRRGPRDCDSFLEQYAKRDTGAEEAFEEVLRLDDLSDNVVAIKMLAKMERKAAFAQCINDICSTNTDPLTPGVCRPKNDEDRRILRRRGGFGGGRRGGPDELCENVEDAEEVLGALTEKFGDPFDEPVTNKPARKAIMMLTMGTTMCGDF